MRLDSAFMVETLTPGARYWLKIYAFWHNGEWYEYEADVCHASLPQREAHDISESQHSAEQAQTRFLRDVHLETVPQ